MAFEEGTATNQEDFITKLRTFALANGWTSDNFDTGANKFSMNQSGIFVHMGWDDTADIEIHQSLAFISAGTALGAHTNDSGNGGSSDALRSMSDIGNGPFTKHTFFAGTTPSLHLYAVLEYAPGLYRHFAAGELDKIGDWTGGEFVCGHNWSQSGANESDPDNSNHSVFMDIGCNLVAIGNTMHLEGMPGEPSAASKWGVSARNLTVGNDTDGDERTLLNCGVRGGPYTVSLSGKTSSLTQGLIPLAQIPCFYRDLDPDPDAFYLLGYFPNIRMVNMTSFQPGNEFVQGSDTWVIFPLVRRLDTGSVERSGFGGLAYLKTL